MQKYKEIIYEHSFNVVTVIRHEVIKDTASPLSHHVMASLKQFSSTQALAPRSKHSEKNISAHDMFQGGKVLNKLRCCVGRDYYKII